MPKLAELTERGLMKKYLRTILLSGSLFYTLIIVSCNNPPSYFDYVYDPMQDEIINQSKKNRVNYSNTPLSYMPITDKVNIKPIAGTTLDLDRQLSVRNPATIRALTVGRYADPNSGTMYERHIVYQVDNSSSWNTRPNPEIELPYGNVVTPPNWANESPLYAELESQLIKAKSSSDIYDDAKQALQSNISTIQESNRALNSALSENQRLKIELLAAREQMNNLNIGINKNREAIQEQTEKVNSFNQPIKVYQTGLVDPSDIGNKKIMKPTETLKIDNQKNKDTNYGNHKTQVAGDEFDSFEV